MVIVSTRKELKDAVKRKESYIKVEGKLVKHLKVISKLQGKNQFKDKKPNEVTSANMVGALTGAEIMLAIALAAIATIGITTIVAILNGYDIESVSKYLIIKTKSLRNQKVGSCIIAI